LARPREMFVRRRRSFGLAVVMKEEGVK